jgi:pimeloyl-ACP methyl ester carboxylesterase
MRVTAPDGLALEVKVVGSGEPVVLLHGWPDSSRLWRHQIEALAAAGRQVIAPDLRGMGGSDRPTSVEGYRVKHAVGDVLAILDAVGAQQADVVGHDFGAAIAWATASFVPDRVRRLAVLSVGHPLAFRAAGLEQRMLSWYMLLFQFEGVAEQWFAEHGAEFLASHPDKDAILAELRQPGRLTETLGWYRANSHPRGLIGPPPALPPVTVPVLGVWSSGDLALTEEQMTTSSEYVTGPWRYERLVGPGHWMQLDVPEIVNAMLLDFLG